MSEIDSYYNGKRSELTQYLPDIDLHTKILEVGCGAGGFRENISISCEYWGVELSPEASVIAKSKMNQVITGKFQDVYDLLPDNYFDCVICADVIEHMDDTDWFLQAIKNKMAKNGVLVGSIPNVRYIDNLYRVLFKKDWYYLSVGILDNTHLRFFTQKSLNRTLIKNNYEIQTLEGINKIKLNYSNINNLILTLFEIFLSFILGSDTKFLQFAFRANINKL